MRELIGKISENLKRVDFERLWKGFHRYPFALYDEKTVYLENGEIARDDRFFGNTAIVYEGGRLAIWNITGDPSAEDAETLAADMVHEMFHAFQQENGEKRYPHDLKTIRYPYDPENFNLKFAENHLLADAYETADAAQKRLYLNEICGLRQKREGLIGDMVECEYRTETLEGMADYMGTSALKMISEEKYAQRCRDYTGKLRKLAPLQLDIRKISYYAGVILLLTAKDMGIDFYYEITGAKEPVWRLIAANFEPDLPRDLSTVGDLSNIKELVLSVRADRENEIEDFIRFFKTLKSGDYTITGYDPMNMLRIKNYILCKTFVRLTDHATNTALILTGETLLEMVSDSENKVVQYFRK